MINRTAQKSVAILVPAHNEEVVLTHTLERALKVVKKDDLYVVSDGSSDKTAKIAKRFTRNLLALKLSGGKATALNTATAHFKLPLKYKYILPLDADTRIEPDFLEKTLKIFEKDKKEKTVCVIGRVIGESNNWLTSYRMWEYETSQLIHKKAQEKEGAIIVCPGCATIYRASLFSKIKFPTDTIVEDMALTFLIHRKKLGKIAFAYTAKVITQDPHTFSGYIKQIRRWYKGYWQCLKKFSVPWKGQALDFELLLLTTEALAGGLMVIFTLLGFLFLGLKQPSFFVTPLILDLLLFFLPTVFLTVFIHSNLKIIKYLPTFYFLRIVNSLVFLFSFFEYLSSLSLGHWEQTARYKVLKGEICTAQ